MKPELAVQIRWVVALLLSISSSIVFACGCDAPIDLSEFEDIARAYDRANEVFSAEVEATLPPHAGPKDPLTARLRVLEVWKGSRPPGTHLNLPLRPDRYLGNCAMDLRRGEFLMVYRNREPTDAGISICSRSGVLRRALPDLTVLHELSRRDPADPLFKPGRKVDFPPPWLPEALAYVYALDSSWRALGR